MNRIGQIFAIQKGRIILFNCVCLKKNGWLSSIFFLIQGLIKISFFYDNNNGSFSTHIQSSWDCSVTTKRNCRRIARRLKVREDEIISKCGITGPRAVFYFLYTVAHCSVGIHYLNYTIARAGWYDNLGAHEPQKWCTELRLGAGRAVHRSMGP